MNNISILENRIGQCQENTINSFDNNSIFLGLNNYKQTNNFSNKYYKNKMISSIRHINLNNRCKINKIYKSMDHYKNVIKNLDELKNNMP